MSYLSLRSQGLSSDSAALDFLKSHFPKVSSEAEAPASGTMEASAARAGSLTVRNETSWATPGPCQPLGLPKCQPCACRTHALLSKVT